MVPIILLFPPTGIDGHSWNQSLLGFTRCMERIMYNNLFRIIQGVLRERSGARTWLTKDHTVKESGYLNRYFFADGPTPTKMFILTSFDDDLGTGTGQGAGICGMFKR